MLKNLAKALYYSLRPEALPPGLQFNLGYIFHTEQIFRREIFQILLEFCKAYGDLTGKKPICALMSGVNPLVVRGMKQTGCTPAEYLERARVLDAVSQLGYHGHFWKDETLPDTPENQIKGTVYLEGAVQTQMEKDLNWFRDNGLDHHGLYSAGWWFMNASLQQMLLSQGFTTDFSTSMSPWFQNPYSAKLMKENGIAFGESFSVLADQRSLFLIQNLIGCHHSPYPQDFVRNLKKLISRDSKTVSGVLNSHDYDLDAPNTLNCLRYLRRQPQVQFFDAEDILDLRNNSGVKSVLLG